jgi:predicted transposase YbfD/YdcC
MKTISKSLLGAFLIVGSIALVGCKGKQKSKEPAVSGEKVIEMYCDGPETLSSKSYLRATGIGESLDKATAMKKSLNEAKTKLAGSVETKIKATIDNYVNSREMNNKEQVEERFEALSREVINQKLANVVTICKKLTQKTDGSSKYVYYCAIEMKAKDIIEAINERITKEETLRIDYDYEKFKETFDKEMEKLEKGL